MKLRYKVLGGVFLGITFILLGFSSASYEKNEHDYAWLAGHWQGEAFGGTTETIWSPPSEDGTMVGLFRLFNADGSIGVYQFILLDRTGMRVKHFTSDLVGWESKRKVCDILTHMPILSTEIPSDKHQ